MRECKKCYVVQPITDFYKHPRGFEGYDTKCKTCAKAAAKLREAELRKNPDWVKAEKDRAKEKYHRLGYREIHKPTPDEKKDIMHRYKEKYPEKYAAKCLSGKIPVQPGFEKHHWSYSFQHAKDIIALCVADHAELHRYITYDQDYFMYRRSDTMELLETKEIHLEYANKVLNKVQQSA